MTEEDKQLSLSRREWLNVIHRSWCHPSSSGVTGVIYRLLELFIGSKEWSIIGFRAIHWLLKWSFVSWSDPSSSGTIYPLLEWSIGSWNDLSDRSSLSGSHPSFRAIILQQRTHTATHAHSYLSCSTDSDQCPGFNTDPASSAGKISGRKLGWVSGECHVVMSASLTAGKLIAEDFDERRPMSYNYNKPIK